MSPLERLIAETIPIRPEPAPDAPRRPRNHRPWTPDEQDAHWNTLCQAVGTPHAQRPRPEETPCPSTSKLRNP